MYPFSEINQGQFILKIPIIEQGRPQGRASRGTCPPWILSVCIALQLLIKYFFVTFRDFLVGIFSDYKMFSEFLQFFLTHTALGHM
jgi:hypothetical protein